VDRPLRCEVCGKRINGKPFKVIIEGAKLTVCIDCSKLGKPYYEEPKRQVLAPRSATGPRTILVQKKPTAPKVDTSQELVSNFDVKIRQARERLGLSHEDLGKRLNEKVSLLRKIETGKMVPNNKLAAMLEHALKIELIVPAEEEKIPPARTTKLSKDLTLGDLVQLKEKGSKKEDKAGRKQS
jgi:putative transcription factor